MEIRQIARVISDFSMLPSFILRMNDRSYEVLSTGSVKDDVFSIITLDLLFRIATENRNAKGFRYIHPTELSLLFFNCPGNTFLVFGPFYIRVRESDLLIKAIEQYYKTNLTAQRKTAVVDSVRVKDVFFSDAWKEIMCSLTGVPSFELEEIRDLPVTEGNVSNKVSDIIGSRMIQADVSFGYGFENKIRSAVMEGGQG